MSVSLGRYGRFAFKAHLNIPRTRVELKVEMKWRWVNWCWVASVGCFHCHCHHSLSFEKNLPISDLRLWVNDSRYHTCHTPDSKNVIVSQISTLNSQLSTTWVIIEISDSETSPLKWHHHIEAKGQRWNLESRYMWLIEAKIVGIVLPQCSWKSGFWSRFAAISEDSRALFTHCVACKSFRLVWALGGKSLKILLRWAVRVGWPRHGDCNWMNRTKPNYQTKKKQTKSWFLSWSWCWILLTLEVPRQRQPRIL